ncbi:MAG: DUF1844 domain-containing protein, partial [Vicinamibacteria bacterium]
MSDEERKSFAVKDRRHFTSDGEARPDAPAVTPADQEPRRGSLIEAASAPPPRPEAPDPQGA